MVGGCTGAPAIVRNARASDVDRFTLGVASGQPRPHSVVLWTRLMGEALDISVPVRWMVARDEGFRSIIAQGSTQAEAAWAHSVHVDVKDLEPGAWYWYRFEALGQRSAVGRTRTAPPEAALSPLRFAITSCQRFDTSPYAAWRHLAGEPLDAVVFLGDYIYEYGSPASGVAAGRAHEGGEAITLDQYRARYAQYKRDRWLQAAHAAFPWWIVWDDHEVENDYANAQGQTLAADFISRRAAAYQAYWEHMPFSNAQRPQRASMRIVDRFTWGRLATLHLLDDRQHRDPQACPHPGRGGSNSIRIRDCAALDDPRRSLLGTAQEQWLQDGWDTQRPWNLVAQQTLMARFAWEAAGSDARVWTDGWDGYPHARQRLLKGLAEKRIGGAVILGGDVHAHYVASLRANADDEHSSIVASEFCGTSISSRTWPQARIDAGVALNPHIHYGRGDRRGAVVFHLDNKLLRADLLGVDDVSREDSSVLTLARFVVEAGRPGPQPA